MEVPFSRKLMGAFGKLDRTDAQLQALRGVIERYLQASLAVGFEERPDEGKVDLFVTKCEQPPVEFSVRIGEIGHNLRSALNLLAHEMIKLNGATPTSRAEFPIFLNESRFPKPSSSIVKGFSECQLSEIRKLQPFTIEKPEDHALWGLHELNNTDKHRMIVDSGRTMGGVELRLAFPHDVTFILPPTAEVYGKGAVVYEGKPLGTLADVRFPFDRACADIRFGTQALAFAPDSGSLSMRPVLQSLVQMSQVVRVHVFASPGCLDGFLDQE